ncbi:MAG: ABC transporter substrate-binding protein [Deltaproteobacteria bacterium]|nr:MAG: ABC transporter substrate-binding protein [Deltaproteobacteria bacterium]
MKNKVVWLLAAAMVFIFGLSLPVAAEVGVTDTEIHIGQWGPQTGPAAPWGSIARGTGDYFKMINAAGGINGRKIVYHMFDDGYNPAKTKAGVKELQEGVGIFSWVAGVGTAPGLAVRDYLMEKKIPWVGPCSGSLHWINPANRYLFPIYPLYIIDAKALVKYAVEKLGKKRFAIAFQNDDYGKNGLRGVKESLKKYGLELVAEVPVEIKDADMKPHVMKLRKAKPDAVLLWVGPIHAVKIVGTSKAMRFAPQWLSTSTCSDFPLMMHISKGLWKGVIASTFASLPDSNDPLITKYKKEVHEKFAAKNERWGIFYYAGILLAEPLVEALKRCGRDLTRERLVTELEGLTDFKGLGGTISFKPFDAKDPYGTRQGGKEVFLIECLDGGKAKKLTDWTYFDYKW